MNRHEYLALISPAIDLVAKKDEDYNKTVALKEYFPFGDLSYVQMLHVKGLRLRNLVEVADGTQNFESKKDTVLDMINYCVFYLAYLKEQEDDKSF